MTHLDIIRAWKDEEYRLSLSDAERALVPTHPAGLTELTDVELGAIQGGISNINGFNLTELLKPCTDSCGSHHQCCPNGFANLPAINTLRVNPGVNPGRLW